MRKHLTNQHLDSFLLPNTQFLKCSHPRSYLTVSHASPCLLDLFDGTKFLDCEVSFFVREQLSNPHLSSFLLSNTHFLKYSHSELSRMDSQFFWTCLMEYSFSIVWGFFCVSISFTDIIPHFFSQILTSTNVRILGPNCLACITMSS